MPPFQRSPPPVQIKDQQPTPTADHGTPFEMRAYLRTRRHICNLIDSCCRLDGASLSACARRKSDRNLPRNRSDGSDGCQSVPASPGPWQAAMMSRSTLAEACWDLSRACSIQGRSSFVLSSQGDIWGGREFTQFVTM